MRTGVRLKLGTRDIEKRPQQRALPQRPLRRHRRKSADAGTAHQAKQQGFGLIITVLPGQQHVIRFGQRHERRVTRLPRRPLQAGAGLHRHPHYVQRHTQRIADRLTMRRPRIGRSLEAVVDMDGAERRE